MSETTGEPSASDTITVIEAFDAMRIFLATVWRRHAGSPEGIAFVIGGATWADGTPADPEIWEDWLMAVRTTRISAVETRGD